MENVGSVIVDWDIRKQILLRRTMHETAKEINPEPKTIFIQSPFGLERMDACCRDRIPLSNHT